jgi:tetratricopeptide (TPR) repeat protein
MADKDVSRPPQPTPEDLAVAARNFEYANRATVGGNHDIAIQMLRGSCNLVPSHLPYRQALRKSQRAKYNDNKRGSSLAAITTALPKARLASVLKAGKFREALDLGEEILSKNPWDSAALILTAEAAARLDLPLVAVWILQDALQASPKDLDLTRAMARLLEEQKQFSKAMAFWEIIRKASPTDREAQEKIKQMAVSDTMSRSQLDHSTSELPALQMRDVSATPPPPTKMTPVQKRAHEEADGLRARIDRDPGRADLYVQLAAVHRRQHQLTEAQAVLKRGLEATGQAAELQVALADLEIEPYRRKLAEVDEQLRANPGDEALQKLRPRVERKINKLELALCEQKAARDPGNRAARFELGVRRFRAGQVQEAIPELQAARAETKLQGEALLYLGRCFQALGNWPLAQRNFDEALKFVGPAEADRRKELLFELASGCAAAGDYERAVELALDLADLDYAYRDIGRLLGQWQAKLAAGGAKRAQQP